MTTWRLALFGAALSAVACGEETKYQPPSTVRMDGGTGAKDAASDAATSPMGGQANPDPPGAGGAGATGDAAQATDGPPQGTAPDSGPPPLLDNGKPCAAPAACASGFCADGVCCETACTGLCLGCVSARTSMRDGVCAAARAGSDPDGECERMAPESCAQDGECDGAGACRKYGTDTLCGPESCALGLYTPARQCDGKGQCPNVMAVACGAFPCEGNRCRMVCTSNDQCVAGNFCQGGQCAAKKPTGMACAAAGDCLSGNCVDGVCCESPCTDRCLACKRTSTEQADGKCAPIKVGTDPDSECNEESPRSCGNDGYCDGKGACRKQPTSVTCTDPRCSNGEATSEGKCDGKGKCAAGQTSSCNGLACDANQCRAMCNAGVGEPAGCLTDRYCEAGRKRCSPPKEVGGGCMVGLAGECRAGLKCATGTNICCRETSEICAGKGAPCTEGKFCASGECDLTDPMAGKCK
jgi:hypothetical protein